MRMQMMTRFGAMLAAAALSACQTTPPPKPISFVGSSYCFPFTQSVAAKFGRETDFAAPRVEATGSGGGVKLFCANGQDGRPQLTCAARRMTPREKAVCDRNGVGKIVEFTLPHQPFYVVTRSGGAIAAMTSDMLWRATAKTAPIDGGLVPNPHTRWSDIDPTAPGSPITVLAPAVTSAAYAGLLELIIEPAALRIPALKRLHDDDKRAFRRATGALREDGPVRPRAGNLDAVLKAVEETAGAVAILSKDEYEAARGAVVALPIDGVAPTDRTIRNGDYPLAYSLYVYAKGERFADTGGLNEFADFMLAEDKVGPGGEAARLGYLPAAAERREAARKAAAAAAR